MSVKSVLLIGDVMLDIYRTGTVSRVSPEAPIPVFDEEYHYYVLGGAANVVLNIRSLMPNAYIDFLFPDVSSIDGSEGVNYFYNELKNNRINVFQTEGRFYLSKKNRFIDKRNKQQIGLRWDRTQEGYLSANDYNIIDDKKYDAIIFSDYNKGCFSNKEFISLCISKAKRDNIPSFLDSKSDDLGKFKGIDIFKPNDKEFKIYENDPNSTRDPSYYFKYVVKTESENGMSLYEKNLKFVYHIDSVVKNIVSTVGAGDTALAGLVYAILAGFDCEVATNIANSLAGKACMQPGTYVVTQDDLKSALDSI